MCRDGKDSKCHQLSNGYLKEERGMQAVTAIGGHSKRACEKKIVN
jgi:hypothetical protein